MAAANYRLCDKCKAKTFYDSDVDYEDSNLGAMAALCKDCAQTHEITIAKRGEVVELRAALEDVYTFIDSEYRNPNSLLGEYISAEAKEVWETICAALARPTTPDRRSWLADVEE